MAAEGGGALAGLGAAELQLLDVLTHTEREQPVPAAHAANWPQLAAAYDEGAAAFGPSDMFAMYKNIQVERNAQCCRHHPQADPTLRVFV